VHFEVYGRSAVEVMTESGERMTAFAYQSSLTPPGRKPSLRDMGLRLEGARQHGLPIEYVSFLESFELAVDERERN